MSIIQLIFEDLPELAIDLLFLVQKEFKFEAGELEIFVTTLILTTMSVVRAVFQIRFSCRNLENVPQVLDNNPNNRTPLQKSALGRCLAVFGFDRKKTGWTILKELKAKLDKKVDTCWGCAPSVNVNTLARYKHYTSVVVLEGSDLVLGKPDTQLEPWNWIGIRTLVLTKCRLTKDACKELFEVLKGPTSIELVDLSENNLDDETGVAFGETLETNTSLQYVS